MAHDRHRSSEVSEPIQPNAGLELLSLAWRRKALLVLGAVVGLVLGSIYFSRLTPVYQSSSQVLVVKKRPDALPMASMDSRYSYFEDYLGTHQAIIKSPMLIQQAVNKGNLRSLRSFASGGDPTGAIIGGLSISRDMKEGGAQNIMLLSYQGTDPEDCAKVLDAVINSYKDFLNETYKNVSDETAKLVKEARTLLDVQVKEKNKAYQIFRVAHPFLIKTKEGGNLRQDRLVSMELRKLQIQDRRAEIQERLDAYEKAKTAKKPLTVQLAILREQLRRELSDDKSATAMAAATQKATLEDQFLVLQMEEKKLLLDYGPDHPNVQAVRSNIEFLRARSIRSLDMGDGNAAAQETAVNEHLKHLYAELGSMQLEENYLQERSKSELKEAQTLLSFEQEESFLRSDYEQTQKLLTSVTHRLEEVNLVKEQGGFVAQVIAPAGPGGRIGPKASPVFSIAVFLGLLSALGLSYLLELSDRGFRTPDDIRRRLGLPVAGCIPTLEAPQEVPADQQSLIDPSLYVYHRPKSREAEAYRGVRTSLLFSARRDKCKIIQVTSPEMSDGKTTLATNLAVAIAQSGKKVVLVDADFRRPRVHKLFGLSGDKGLASVLRGEAELADVRQLSGIPDLTVLACGPIPPNPAELLASSQFHESLKALAADADFVIVDTPPLLAVTDPSVVIPCVDGVLLTIRLTKNARPNAERAKDLLETMGAKVLGVVVNDVGGKETKGYGYGSYYAYGASGYYAEEEGQETPAVEGTVSTRGGDRREKREHGTRGGKNSQGKKSARTSWFFNW